MNRKALALNLLCGTLMVSTGASADFRDQRSVSAPVIAADTLLLRPFGLVLTVAGTAFFVAISPLTLVANIAPPHDAFYRTSNSFIMGPAAFTFVRPLGEFSYNPSGIYPLRPGEPLGTGYYYDEYGNYRPMEELYQRPANTGVKPRVTPKTTPPFAKQPPNPANRPPDYRQLGPDTETYQPAPAAVPGY